MKASRRALLRTGVAAGGALALEWVWPAARATGRTSEGGALRFGSRMTIDASGRVTLSIGRVEMGQGVRTALPMLVAEELEIDPRSIAVEQARPGFDFPDMRTSGSGSVFTQGRKLAQLGATAREMLAQAACERWSCAREECEARDGFIVRTSGEKLGYGELVERAAKLAPPRNVALKPRSRQRVLGTSVRRVDGPAIASGRALFGIDVRRPDMLFASIERAPVLGGELENFDAARAKRSPGVVDVVRIPSGVAVVARTTWQALRGRELLDAAWKDGPFAAFDSAEMRHRLERAFEGELVRVRDEGDVDGSAARRVEATYEVPFQAHAPLEPLTAVADVRADRCEVWVGTQAPNELQNELAELLGLDLERVVVNIPLLGGGFGLRLGTQFGLEAAELSRALRKPVQVVWTRSDTLKHAYYWPASMHRLEAGLDERGELVGWRHRVASPSVLRSMGVADGMSAKDVAQAETPGAADFPYRSRAVRVEHAAVDNHVPLGPWRGIWYVPNVFAREAFLDEVAHAAGRDPLALRLQLLAARDDAAPAWNEHLARLRGVLERAASRAGWGRELGPGRGLGLACCSYHGPTYVAQVVEVRVDRERRIRVERVVCAVDCGQVINRSGLEGTIESAIHFGLSAALLGSLTFERGRVVQSSYADFPVVRIGDAPRIEIDVVDSAADPGGMGEPPVPPLAPALVNAIFAATGTRVRRLPARL